MQKHGNTVANILNLEGATLLHIKEHETMQRRLQAKADHKAEGALSERRLGGEAFHNNA